MMTKGSARSGRSRARAGLDEALRARIATRLDRGDQRFTRGREALLAVLANATRPLTIPEVGAADPSLAVSSIYRNLTTLAELGVVHCVVTAGDFAHYELAEDLTDHHHHHLICSVCGVVEDFEAPEKLELAVRDAARRVTRGAGFHAESHVLDLIGVCRNCS